MISIERVTNGYIARIEEADEDATLVCQREFDSMNMALGAVCKMLIDQLSDNMLRADVLGL